MGRKVVFVSPELWQHICTEGYQGTFRCVKGLPEGARFLHADYDVRSDSLGMVFEHDSWPPTHPGKCMEPVRIEHEHVRQDKAGND